MLDEPAAFGVIESRGDQHRVDSLELREGGEKIDNLETNIDKSKQEIEKEKVVEKVDKYGHITDEKDEALLIVCRKHPSFNTLKKTKIAQY